MDTDKPVDRQAGTPARRPRDMVISLLVLLVPVLLLVGGYQLIAGRTQPVAVDPAPALAAAAAAGMDVRTPADPPGWVPISAVYGTESQGETLRIGYVTAAGASVQLIQSSSPAEQLLVAVLPAATPAGTVEVAGQPWQRYTTRSGEQVLVWLEPELAVLVVGDAATSELVDLAAGLA